MLHDDAYSMMTAGLVKPVHVVRVSPEGSSRAADAAAAEEPLEVRIDGEPFAVIMRTPGADEDLVAGFLFSERVVRSAREILAVERTNGRTVINVSITSAHPRHRRLITTNSSCGLCGRTTIDSLRVDAPNVSADWCVRPEVIAALPDALRRAQPAFAHTGGLHAAGLFTRQGDLELVAEDVGRHNALDKIIGRMLVSDRLPLVASVLFVSGRTSYEIVQKALLAGIPVVASVSAPSSLAVELAEDAGITLIGFVRGSVFNVYSHARRISDASDRAT